MTGHIITEVLEGSIAEELGLRPGDRLLALNDEPVIDLIDYKYFTSLNKYSVTIQQEDGEAVIYDIEQDEDEFLGLCFKDDLIKVKRCQNKCVFCFVDQLPPNLRSTLYVKDDDWRLSFIMGNYITLTNLTERDIQRIISRRVSPLYISVHTTDPELRRKMLNNPKAGELMPVLERFARNGIDFHAQIVLCPGLNDGFQLRKTFEDLLVLYPHCLSLAVVPVGLTYHRRGLYKLRRVSEQDACHIIDDVERWQEKCLEMKGTRFIFAADEMYLTANRELPPYETYEGFCQLENGVGMLAKFERELLEILPALPPWIVDRKVSIACGVSVAPFINRLCGILKEKYANLDIYIYPIHNHFFGESVNVTGLITGRDIAVQLDGQPLGDELLISRSMLREKDQEQHFLDDLTVLDVSNWINHKITPTDNDGAAFALAVLGLDADSI